MNYNPRYIAIVFSETTSPSHTTILGTQTLRETLIVSSVEIGLFGIFHIGTSSRLAVRFQILSRHPLITGLE